MSRQRVLLVAVAAALVALAGCWFGVLAPRQERIAALDTEIAAQQAATQTATQLLAGHEAARREYGTSYAQMLRLGKALPVEDDVRSLMLQLDRAAEAYGVDFRTVSVGAEGGPAADGAATATTAKTIPGASPVGSEGLSAMPFSFTFTGTFFDLSSFLARVERFVTLRNRRIDVTGRLMLLSTLKLTPDDAGFPTLRAEIGATAYLSAPPEETPGAAAPAPGAGAVSAPATEPATTTATVR